MWEDVFVEFLGLDWRQTQSTCTTYSDGRAGEASFVQRVCSEWGWPWKPDQTTPSFLDPLSNVVPKSLNTMLAWHDHPEDVAWQSPRGCIQFIIDNQALAMLLSRTVLLSDVTYRPVLVRMCRNLAALISKGWNPCAPHRDFIQWRPRVHNPVADQLCNLAMDANRNITDLDVEGIWETVRN